MTIHRHEVTRDKLALQYLLQQRLASVLCRFFVHSHRERPVLGAFQRPNQH